MTGTVPDQAFSEMKNLNFLHALEGEIPKVFGEREAHVF